MGRGIYPFGKTCPTPKKTRDETDMFQCFGRYCQLHPKYFCKECSKHRLKKIKYNSFVLTQKAVSVCIPCANKMKKDLDSKTKAKAANNSKANAKPKKSAAAKAKKAKQPISKANARPK